MGRKPDPNKKQHIIETAAAVFAHKGYAGTRMIAIAEAAGIGKGTIYEYFRNKEGLFFAVFQYMVQAPMNQIFSTCDFKVGSAADRMKRIAELIIEAWISNLEMYSLVMEFWSAATALPSRLRFKDAFRQVYTDMRGLAAGLIQEGIDGNEFDPQIQADKIAAAMVGALDSFLLQAWLDQDFDARDVSRVFMNLILEGMQRPKASE
jgi:AcrR family transcriptional regulator